VRILLTADPYLPVPPRVYGGIERVVDFLVRGLVSRGHEVTLLAHPESRTAGALIPYGAPPHSGPRARLVELVQVGRVVWQRRRAYDLVHSFGRLAALAPILPVRRIPKVQSYQRRVPWGGVTKAAALAGESICFTSCSASLTRDRPPGASAGRWEVVWNGVDLGKYPFSPVREKDAPLVFLGRLEPEKGAHTAIRIAQSAGRRLVIAGNRVESEYFAREIAPHLDEKRVDYVGPVDDDQKSRLLRRAAALLMPVEWEEPFGIVMAEALASGTPVIGFARGSVPEVVRDGVNGFVCETVEGAADAVSRLESIDRHAVRRDCEARFASDVVVDAYERIYRSMVGGRW